MNRTMLNAKIHRATVTDCDLHYVGAITIAGEPGSGEIKGNGAAARLVHRGDTIIVIASGSFIAGQLTAHRPRVVHVDDANRIIATDSDAATLMAAFAA
ncbi:MAG: aspartate 1-decarboxylase [Actinomycetota bacterium]|nr:aspartate 1-decarboxylase [Actinomycetota bacterium]